jgi:malonyl-CoA O-methyltransferase
MFCEPQKVMADRLMSLLGSISPCSILELGCGTGVLTEKLNQAYPHATITAVDIALGMIRECKDNHCARRRVNFIVGDAENLRIGGMYDLIISSSCFQWLSDISATMRNLSGRLTHGGLLAFSAPAMGSLPELRESYYAVSGKEAGHNLPDPHDYLRSVIEAGCVVESSDVEKHVFLYASPELAVRAIHEIGASRARRDGHGLTPAQLKAMLQRYRATYSQADGQVPLTYSVQYVRARRK